MDKTISLPGDTKRSASFVLTFALVAWIETEARRRGISNSEFVREILDAAMTQQDKAA